MSLSARDQIILSVAVIVLVTVAFVFLAIVPQFRAGAELEVRSLALESDIAGQRTLLETRRETKAGAADTQMQLLELSSRLPEAPDLPGLIIELQDRANEAELDFFQVTPGAPAGSSVTDVSAMSVAMSIRGTWEQYIEYLGLLEDMTRDVRVLNMSISPQVISEEGEDGGTDGASAASAGDDEHVVAVSINVSVYMMSEELSSQAATGAAPVAPGGETPAAP